MRKGLEALNRQYPHLVSPEVVNSVEYSFKRIRELVLTTRTYALLIYIELGRIHRVQKRLMALGYFDVLGRVRLTVHLVRVTLAVPYRVDRALKRREREGRKEREEREGRTLGEEVEGGGGKGILNERVSWVLEYIVGDAGRDEEVDGVWDMHTKAKVDGDDVHTKMREKEKNKEKEKEKEGLRATTAR